MEAIGKFQINTLPYVVKPTREIFLPLLEAQRFQISKTPKKTFQYGLTERHKIDIYYPSSGSTNFPILFFVYGGGFVTGSRELYPGLVFDNIGAFFAQRGILTAIADYRLAPQTTYPGPAKDIRDAIRFALTSSDVNVIGSGADINQVYIFGHSAGAAHLSTLLLNEDILTDQERSHIKGAILMGGAYGSAPHLTMYYGDSLEDIDEKCPIGLLNSKSSEKIAHLLPHKLLLLLSEKEEPIISEMDQMFRKALREKGVADFHSYTLMGHNHVSPGVCLSSGEGEEWGEEVARWIKV